VTRGVEKPETAVRKWVTGDYVLLEIWSLVCTGPLVSIRTPPVLQ